MLDGMTGHSTMLCERGESNSCNWTKYQKHYVAFTALYPNMLHSDYKGFFTEIALTAMKLII